MNTTGNDEKFRVGDTVRIKNVPGPRMIITGFGPETDSRTGRALPSVHCKWFDKGAHLNGEWFPAKLLIRIAPWTERPGYRAALERINAVFGESTELMMDHNTTLGMFIADVLEHAHQPARSALTPEPADETAEVVAE